MRHSHLFTSERKPLKTLGNLKNTECSPFKNDKTPKSASVSKISKESKEDDKSNQELKIALDEVCEENYIVIFKRRLFINTLSMSGFTAERKSCGT